MSARCHLVKRSIKSPGRCTRCRKKIKKGQPYFWFKFMKQPKRVRCPDCKPRRAELTRSDFWATVYDIQDIPWPTSLEEMKDSLQSRIDDLQQLRDETEEKYNNQVPSLQDGPSGQMLQERVDAIDNAIQTLEAIDCEEPDSSHEEDGDGDDNPDPDREQEIYDKIAAIIQEADGALDLQCE